MKLSQCYLAMTVTKFMKPKIKHGKLNKIKLSTNYILIIKEP